MGEIEKNRKFKRQVEQKNPSNPKINNTKVDEFDLDNSTIKEQQSKK
ncbi:hypothetical protein [Algibacter pacificus]|nr:hypothetical protein [Algibacter pacificus]